MKKKAIAKKAAEIDTPDMKTMIRGQVVYFNGARVIFIEAKRCGFRGLNENGKLDYFKCKAPRGVIFAPPSLEFKK